MIVATLINLFNTYKIPVLITVGMLPFIFRNREPCYDDDDCPFIMKCCILGIEQYCCTPNNYIKYKPIYLYENGKNK